jgi:hypothetical protein
MTSSNPRNIPVARVAPPPSPNDAEIGAHEQSTFTGVGIVVLLIGIVMALSSLVMDIASVRALIVAIFGSALFLAGCLFLVAGALLRKRVVGGE